MSSFLYLANKNNHRMESKEKGELRLYHDKKFPKDTVWLAWLRIVASISLPAEKFLGRILWLLVKILAILLLAIHFLNFLFDKRLKFVNFYG